LDDVDPIINREFQTYTFYTDENLMAGEQYDIYMEYVAKIGGPERVLGMYHRKYEKPDGSFK